eukprot:UN10204
MIQLYAIDLFQVHYDAFNLLDTTLLPLFNASSQSKRFANNNYPN